MKLVTIMNSERCDFVYYLGRILSQLSVNVILIDNSEKHELFRTIQGLLESDDKEEKSMIERGNVTYLKDVAYSPEFFASFDYIVVLMGNNHDEEYVNQSDLLFSMPDYRPDTLDDIAGLPETAMYIMRDKAGKINEKSAAEIMNILPTQIVGSIDYDYNDYSAYLALLYNGRQRLKGLSQAMIEALAFVVAKASEKDEKDVLKALKKERKEKV